MENLQFQFKGFKILRSLIEKKEGNPSQFLIEFEPSGAINKKDSCFQLFLKVLIEDKKKVFKVEITSMASFHFSNKIEKKQLNNLFYINAPAMLFPYLRAYISTLTNLSGYDPVNLPTLNISSLGKKLEENTKEINKVSPVKKQNANKK
ncbi:MAG: protein-export chaperone SecB [Bacteroidales bacterium]|jgi:preprotein translocase subunit SecB